MRLEDFFAAARPFMEGRTSVRTFRKAGKTPSPDADLAFYPWLVAFDQQRILAELFPLTKQLLEASGHDWTQIVQRYVRAHPPSGVSVPHLGQHFPAFLTEVAEKDPRIPVGADALTDLVWTRFLAKNAPDGDGLGLGRRVFVRRYTLDPRLLARHLQEGLPLAAGGPCTLVIYRDEGNGGTKLLAAGLPTIAVLHSMSGHTLTGALLLPAVTMDEEVVRLTQSGVLPTPHIGEDE